VAYIDIKYKMFHISEYILFILHTLAFYVTKNVGNDKIFWKVTF